MFIQFSIRSMCATSVLLLATGVTGCASQPDEPPIATLAGSAPSQELGVTSWEVYKQGDAVRIVGLDAAQQRRTEMLVEQAESTEHLRVQVEFPEQREFEFTRGGVLNGDTSPFVERLRAAMAADLSERTIAVAPNSRDGLAAAEQNAYLQNTGSIQLGWSFFGYRGESIENNNWCGRGPREYASAKSISGASCWVVDWLNDDPYHCGIIVHYGIGGFRTDTCVWNVYSNPVL